MKKSAVEYLVKYLNLDETSPNYNKLTIEKARAVEEEINDIKYLTGTLVGIFAGIAIGFLMFG
jgi:hypothetical protein